MAILTSIVLFLAILIAIVFSLLVLLTGKGDAMSGGGSVRTSYKGKATFDDIMSRAALYLGVSFMGLVLLYNVLSVRLRHAEDMGAITAPVSTPVNNAPAGNNAPATNAPASNNVPASNNAPATNAPATTAANNAPATNAPANNAPATNAPATNAPTSMPTAGNNAPATNSPAASNAPKK